MYKNNTLLYMRRQLKSCPPGMIIDPENPNKCKCKPGYEATNKGTCVKKPIRPKCTLGKEYRESKKKCVCKPGLIERHGRCIKKDIPEKCPAGSVRNKQGVCVCIRGHTMVDGKCVKNTQKRTILGTRKLKPPTRKPSTKNPLTRQMLRESQNSLASSSSMSNGFNDLMKLMHQSRSSTRSSSRSSTKTPSPPKISKPVEEPKKIKLTIIRTPKKAHESLEIIKRECPSSLDCLLLNNKHRDKIKSLFDHFKSFTSLKSISHLESGGNADVCLLTYNYHEYETKALMKTQKSRQNDSLVYEFLMGKQINRYLSFLPNFLETYSLYEMDSGANKTLISLRNHFKYNNKTEQELLQQEIDKTTRNALLLEYVHNSTKMDLKNKDFVENDLIPVLFQIYYALYKLKGKFVHYDLYIPNIMLYEPYKGSHIKFQYQIEGKTYEFYSRYIAKIIDYGRVFTTESYNIHQRLCKLQPKICGRESGFPVSDKSLKDYFHYDYVKPNQSSDLSLLYQLKDKLTIDNDYLEELFELLPELEESPQPGKYDIPPKSSSGKMINNVTDAFEYLKKVITIKTKKPSSKSADIIVHGMDKPYELVEDDSISANESSIESSPSLSEMASSLENSSDNSYNRTSSLGSSSKTSSENNYNNLSRTSNNSVFNYNNSSRTSSE
jgi:hypothetical protein